MRSWPARFGPVAKHRLRLGGAALYLLVVGVGAFTAFPYNLPDAWFAPVYGVMDYVAANNDFGYFAPAVSSQIQTSFRVYEPGRPPVTLDFLTDNPELNIRINSLVTVAMKQPLLQDVCARSWAAFVLGSYPRAERVAVVTQAYFVPTLAAYRAGQRPRWIRVHEVEFERTAYAGSELRR